MQLPLCRFKTSVKQIWDWGKRKRARSALYTLFRGTFFLHNPYHIFVSNLITNALDVWDWAAKPYSKYNEMYSQAHSLPLKWRGNE